jgi:hypothetical protein
MPRRFITRPGQTGGPSPVATCLGQPHAFPAGVRSPPLRGTAKRAKNALRGQSRDDARGGFLGGARSPRPRLQGRTHAKAFHYPSWMAEGPVGLPGTCLGQASAFLSGRAEPAPPGVDGPRGDGFTGANPEMTRKAVFSEGRTLCVRVARPDASRGIPFPPGDEARGRLAYRTHASVKPVSSSRACGARPSARWTSEGEGALRKESPGMTRKAVFSEILCWVVKPPWFRESGLPGNETLG